MQIAHFKRSAAAALLAAFSVSSQAVTHITPPTTLKFFGDSLSDSGNNALVLGNGGAAPDSNTYIPSGAPYVSGTYSNGNVWVNAFASAQGQAFAANPAPLGGGNYASGGARTVALGPAPSATAQVNYFLSGVTSLPSNGLYVIAVGGNDVRDTLEGLMTPGSGVSLSTQAAAYALAVGDMVDALQAKGAQHIVVWDAPDVGKTPAALAYGSSFAAAATNVATAFNFALASRLYGEAGVIPFDIFGVVNDIVASPGSYGLLNVIDACGAGSFSCSTALFYDGIHPTAAGHALLATAMINTVAAAVPEPSTWLMLAAGAAVLVLRRRA